MEKVKIPESKFKVGDRVKIVKSVFSSRLVGNYATICNVFYESVFKERHIYKLKNLSKFKNLNPYYWFDENDLEFASTKKINLNKKNDTFTTPYEPYTPNKTIVSHEIIGNTTYVTLSNGDKGIARCNPEDKFDAYIGLKLAAERAYGVEIAVKPTQQKEYRSIASYLKPDNYAKEVCYPSEKAKFKKGDYVYIAYACCGCQGANGRRGIVTDRQATNGLTNDPSIDTTNVLLSSGSVWRVNTDGLEFAKSTL